MSERDQPTRYGFVGLGNLGAKLAASLVEAGYEIRGHDLNTDAAANIGAIPARTPAEAALGVDGLITCLPSPAASSQALLGDDGALAALAPGSTWIEMSTTGRSELERLASAAGERGIEVLECPVTGGLHRAAAGEITVLVGGDDAVLDRHLPALEVMCGDIIHMGELGTASTIKVITNLLALANLQLAGEALTLAKLAGLDLARCYQAICASSGNSAEFEDYAPVVLNGSFDTGFTLDLACKDLGFAGDIAREHGAPLPVTDLVERLFAEAREAHGGEAWTPHVLDVMEEATGAPLRVAGFIDALSFADVPEDG